MPESVIILTGGVAIGILIGELVDGLILRHIQRGEYG